MKDNDAEQLYIRLVRQVNANYLVTSLANLLISFIMAHTLREVVPPHRLVGWLVVFVAVVGSRAIHAHYVRFTTYSQARKTGRIYLCGLALTGMAWGMSAIFLFPEGSLPHQTFISFVVGGMVIGAAASSAGLDNAILLFAIPALAPLIIRFFAAGTEISTAMGLMLVIFLCASVAISKKIRQLIVATITSNLEKEKEIEVRLNVENELEKHREDLEETIKDRTKELYQANIELAEQIQERKLTERKYQDIFNSTTDAMFLHDAATGAIIEVNQAMLEMYGYTNEEVLAVEFEDLSEGVAPYTQVEAREKIRATATAGPQIFEWRAKKKNQELFWVEVALKYSEFEDGQYVIAVVRNVETRKRDEESRLKVGRLESLGQLAGGIAHDFNNILTVINGNVNMALDDPNIKGETREILDEAGAASTRAGGLTQQLLTFAKGGEPIKMASSLKEVITDSAGFVLRGSKCSAVFHIPDDLYLVEIDPDQISQVIQNIVLNGEQAMANGGLIQITCENVAAADSLEIYGLQGKHVRVKISDSGSGISPQLIDKIFDPYFSTKETGNGLGLAICHSIIAKHHGSISVSSTLGAGSTFTILLPAASSRTMPNKEVVAQPAAAGGASKVMVMDDEDGIRKLAQRAINNMGHEVVLAKNGDEAVQLYSESLHSPAPIDLVVMDLTIPGGMGGKEAAEKILALNPGAKIIVASGYSNDPVMAGYAEFGFCAAIEKPYSLQDLKKMIASFLPLK